MNISVLGIIDNVFSGLFLIFLFVLFYLSIKKCFLHDKIGKWRIVIISVFSFPVILFFFVLVINIFLYTFLIVILQKDIPEITSNILYSIIFFSSVLYALIIILEAYIGKKFLKLNSATPLLFLYIMFSAIFLLIFGSSGDGNFFQDSLNSIVNIFSTIIAIVISYAFYRLDVMSFSELVKDKVKISWKLFIIPPMIFNILYFMFSFMTVLDINGVKDNNISKITALFSNVIVLLFIWAFYVVIRNLKATNEAIKAKDDIKTLSVEVMEALAHTIDAKDEYTKGHSVRVAKYSKMLCKKLGLSDEDSESVYYMALLHDIGKISVPNEIINGTSKMTDEEYAIMKLHPSVGFDILSEIKSRPDLVTGARWHHERYDGKGYPDGKAGDEIPYFARIIAVADSYDAMTSNRSYRKYLPQDVVRSEIEKNSGTQFDPNVAKCMLEIIDADVNYEYHE